MHVIKWKLKKLRRFIPQAIKYGSRMLRDRRTEFEIDGQKVSKLRYTRSVLEFIWRIV